MIKTRLPSKYVKTEFVYKFYNLVCEVWTQRQSQMSFVRVIMLQMDEESTIDKHCNSPTTPPRPNPTPKKKRKETKNTNTPPPTCGHTKKKEKERKRLNKTKLNSIMQMIFIYINYLRISMFLSCDKYQSCYTIAQGYLFVSKTWSWRS